jgi:hypothetical protein
VRRLANVIIALCLAVFICAGFIETACAESLEKLTKALDLITDTADKICNIVRPEGSSQQMKVTGEVKAELGGLIKRLDDLGISGASNFETDEYEGVLQADLAVALQRNIECKLKIFQKLREKMIK